jgi:hypothetical protein
MDAPERAAYERELVRSPERRDELVSAAAWLDEIEGRQEAPPVELTALALALDGARPEPQRRSGFVAFIERMFPGPRLAIATSAIASFAIVAVGFDVALHVNPRLMPTQQVAVGPGATPAAHPHYPNERPWVDPSAQRPDDRPTMTYPTREAPLFEGAVGPELRDALLAFRRDASQPHRQQLLVALAGAGLRAADARRVTSIMVQPALYDLGATNTDARIMARLAVDGTLVLEVARPR